jgi:catechol 2,3-dioxygenase-like lactoylglutathione lyase family enzyme
MNGTQTINEHATQVPTGATVDLKLEVIVLPVSDVDRAKRFYEGLGWRVDADFTRGDSWRVVQTTPPGSPCSIQFGKGITNSVPGSVQGTYLVVDDIRAARAELAGHGADVGEIFHVGATGREPGPDPEGRSYASFASFSDPDGNSWLLQEIKTRLPGRGLSSLDLPNLIELLREAETRHGAYEATAPKHHWSGWYGAYMVARERGKTPEQAASDASRYMDGARQ